MKHAWILSHYAQRPTDKGGLTRHHSLGKYLLANGWRVTIITASTDHPSGRQRTVHTEQAPESFEGIPYLWLRTPDYSGNGLDRIRNMVAFGWRALVSPAMSKLDKPDLIMGSSPHPMAALAAARLARRHKVPFVYEVRDLWPEALVDMGRIGAGGATALAMRRIERSLFRSACRSVVLWPNVGAYMQEQGIDAPSPAWIPNGVDFAALPPPSPVQDRDVFTLMYLGAHGGANALENVIQAMRLVQDRPQRIPVRLRLIGAGPDKPRLRELAAEIGLNNVSFEDAVEKQLVPRVAAEADAFIFNLLGAPMFRYGISPNKLYEYMAAQRPVIFACEAFNNPIAESGGGLSVPPGNPARLADAILGLANTSLVRRREMALAARQHAETHYGFDHLAESLAEVFDQCVRAPLPNR